MSGNLLIKYSEFFQDDGGMKKTKEDFIKLSDELIAKAKEVRKETRIIGAEDSKGIDELVRKTTELTQARNLHNQALKKIAALEKKLANGRKKSSKSITAETEAMKKNNAEARQRAKIQNTQVGTIENMRAKLALVTTAWTKLTAEELKNTKRGQRLNQSKKQLTAELRRLEAATNDNRRNVGNYSSALSGLRGRFVRLAQAAGITVGIFGAFRLIKNSISIIRDFEKQNATLAGVLQVTKTEMSELTDDSKRLGQTTVKTATEVSKLQTAYARLGFTQQEILALTEPSIQGSIALNSELDATANLVGAIVNSYDGLEATDAPAIIDTLSLATAKSALNFEKLNVGLPIVLGAANALNVPLTEVTATLGKLSDAGIETSTGATSLRNIFIESAKRGIDYKDALAKITNSTDKLGTANKIFGKRAAVSALVVANNTEKVAELDLALQNAAGTAEEMAEKELNTLDGSIKLLTSAWEGMVLEISSATNGSNVLASSLRFLAENLQTIFKVIGIATTAWLSYVIAKKASNLATKLGLVIDRGATIATNLKTIATNAATAAQKAFNLAAKANPLGILIALLAAAVTAYYAFGNSVDEAARKQQRLNELKLESGKKEKEQIDYEDEAVKKKIGDLEYEIALRKRKGENSEKLDKEELERKKKIISAQLEENQAIIDGEKEKQKGLITQAKLLRKQGDKGAFKSKNPNRTGGRFEVPSVTAEYDGLSGTEDARAISDGKIEERNKKLQEINKTLIESERQLTLEMADLTDKQIKDRKKRVKELSLLQRRLEDLRDGSIANDESREIQITTRKFNREIKAIKGNSQIEIDLRAELEDEKQRRISDVKDKYQKQRLVMLKRANDIEISLIEDDSERQIAIERKKTKKLIDEIAQNTSILLFKRLELIALANKKQEDFETRLALDMKVKKLENQRLIDTALIEQRRGEFATQKEYEKFKDAELLKIQRKYLNDRLTLLQSYGGEEFKVEIEQIKAELANLGNGIDPPDIDPWEEFANNLKSVLTTAADEIEKALSRAVESSQKALDEQQKAVDNQRSRAEKGLTNTLKFEQEQQAKREADVIKRQKRLDRIQKLKSYWNTYNANLNSLKQGEDSGKAIQKTIRDIAVIEALTATLTSFGDGGVVEDKLPRDGIFRGQSHSGPNGGIPIMVEGKEGIFSTKEMANMGKDNFYKLKHLASNGPIDSNFFSGQYQGFTTTMATMSVSDPRLIAEMREVKNAIQSQPHQSLEVPQVVDGVMKFTETITSKNKVKRNHYVIKKRKI